jgi:prevent-host-death family protein
MEILTITEAKAQLSAVVEKVMNGEEVILGKAGKPVARVVPYEPPQKDRVLGRLKGKIHMADDFDEWPEAEARALGIID